GLVLGFFISIAEPDLHILADQVEIVTSGLIDKVHIVVVVSIGIAVMVSIGFIRIVYNLALYKILMAAYGFIFILSLFSSKEFLAIAFDSSGATTGALAVPFILALSIGISALKKDSKASEKDSFGLIAVASTGAIITVLIMGIISGTRNLTGSIPNDESMYGSVLGPFLHEIPIVAVEIFYALAPIVIIFILGNIAEFKLPKKTFRRIAVGLIFTFLGLIIFLAGVNAGFMEAGRFVGYKVALYDNKGILLLVGFLLGVLTILAEPAVHVLTHQVEGVTSGYINRKLILAALSLGVGLAIALSMLRIIIPEMQLWHFLLPGYFIAVLLTFFAPKLFVGIAFDSGGVASGPMTATFILAFARGAAEAIEGANVLIDGFGIIAMVAMTPIITLQILGLMFRRKSELKGDELNVE
ncbi:MAG: DUF1538 domain-containing protein, partial [Clostridiales bacterium]|nr:DUF1538 domain-containing protein [Clostridiales bacterium]